MDFLWEDFFADLFIVGISILFVWLFKYRKKQEQIEQREADAQRQKQEREYAITTISELIGEFLEPPSLGGVAAAEELLEAVQDARTPSIGLELTKEMDAADRHKLSMFRERLQQNSNSVSQVSRSDVVKEIAAYAEELRAVCENELKAGNISQALICADFLSSLGLEDDKSAHTVQTILSLREILTRDTPAVLDETRHIVELSRFKERDSKITTHEAENVAMALWRLTMADPFDGYQYKALASQLFRLRLNGRIAIDLLCSLIYLESHGKTRTSGEICGDVSSHLRENFIHYSDDALRSVAVFATWSGNDSVVRYINQEMQIRGMANTSQ